MIWLWGGHLGGQVACAAVFFGCLGADLHQMGNVMGKRSDFQRIEKDYYRTIDARAVAALAPHLAPQTRYCEPCAGAGDLMDQLTALGHVCARARDIAPQRDDIEQKDALTTLTGNIDCFITNPPWSRPILHPLISFLSSQHPTWLLSTRTGPIPARAHPIWPIVERL